MAQSGYGSYSYESPESRALGSITSESYDKDQAKNLIKLNNDVSYMAAYMRKMQKGIDEANQNVIQQIQSFINDVVVLLGGGSAQGFDFGDLKYILQMIGALLGLGDADFPLSAFEAVWHMLSTYIFPSAQFADVINAMIDAFIGSVLDTFGEVPIVGEALQQLAEIILNIRDFLNTVGDDFQGLLNLLGNFNGAGINDAIEGIFQQLGLQVDIDLTNPITFITGIIDLLFGDGSFINQVIEAIFGDTGFDLSGAFDWVNDIADAVQDTIDGIVGGVGNPASSVGAAIANFLTGTSPLNAANLMNMLGIPAISQSKITNLISDLAAKLDPTSALNAANINNLANIGAIAQSKITNLVSDLTNALTQAGTANTNAGNALDTAVGWLTGFWNGVTGQNANPGDISVPDAQAQAAAISETQSAQSAAIAALQAQNDGTTFQGINGSDSFDRVTANGLGGASFWAETLLTSDTGAYTYCNGSELKMVDGSGNSPHHYRYRCLIPGLATTLTDYQKIIITCGADQQEQATSGNTACWRIYFRVNASEAQYGFIEIGGNNLAQWGYKNGGSDTFIGSSFSCSLPTAGTNFTVRIGTTAGVRYYELYRNGTFVNRWIDSSNLVVTGPSNRGWGFGVRWGTRFLGQATPASVGSVSIADNLPPTILGSGFRAYNSSGTATPTVTGTQKFPSNFFNATAIKSDDLTYAPGTSNRLTISVAGWYMVKMQQQMSYGGNVSKHFYFALYKNGAVEQISGTDSWTSNWSSTSSGGCEGTFIIYCAAGDYLEPGYDVNSSTGSLMPGDAAGLRSYWSVSLLNRSYV